MSGKKLSFLEIAKLNKDKIVKKEEVVTETKKKEDTNYLYNEEYEDDINIKNFEEYTINYIKNQIRDLFLLSIIILKWIIRYKFD